MKTSPFIACGLILAAGKSSRMGLFKTNLPWKDTTVLGSVIRNMAAGGLNRIYIVVSPKRIPQIPDVSRDTKVEIIENRNADEDEMLGSIQTGLRQLPPETDYVLICPGDQPTIEPEVVRLLLKRMNETGAQIIFPSYRMRRGHPWVISRDEWKSILELSKDESVRKFIQARSDAIEYVCFEFDPPEDMDTPEDYQSLLKRYGVE